jgi:hypothetical protein
MFFWRRRRWKIFRARIAQNITVLNSWIRMKSKSFHCLIHSSPIPYILEIVGHRRDGARSEAPRASSSTGRPSAFQGRVTCPTVPAVAFTRTSTTRARKDDARCATVLRLALEVRSHSRVYINSLHQLSRLRSENVHLIVDKVIRR